MSVEELLKRDRYSSNERNRQNQDIFVEDASDTSSKFQFLSNLGTPNHPPSQPTFATPAPPPRQNGNLERIIEERVMQVLASQQQSAYSAPQQPEPYVYPMSASHSVYQTPQPSAQLPPQPPRQTHNEIDEIREETRQLRNDMRSMTKHMENLSVNVSEKEAEIIQLNMNLNDERAKLNQRSYSRSTLR